MGPSSVFATLGMVPAVIVTVGIGLIAIYTSYIVGLTCLKYPEVVHYDQVGYLFFGKIGKDIFGVIFVIYLSFVTASHVLTGTELWNALSTTHICSLAFGVISAIILYLVALPPTFHDMAVLGYVDFASICLAILITMIGTGIQGQKLPGGLANADWHAFPQEPVSFKKAFVAVTNIVFAYSFAACQPSFMSEMHRPKDFVKSIWALGLIEIFIYTVTGAVIYSFVGSGVESPALLSAGGKFEKAAWGVAIPVVFISGSINSQVAGRYAHMRMFQGTKHVYINTVKGWAWWLGIIAAITLFAWIVAEAIPFFSDMLSIISSLFISGYSFFWPGFMWWILLRKKGTSIFGSKTSMFHAFASTLSIIIGFTVVVAGLYASIEDIVSVLSSVRRKSDDEEHTADCPLISSATSTQLVRSSRHSPVVAPLARRRHSGHPSFSCCRDSLLPSPVPIVSQGCCI